MSKLLYNTENQIIPHRGRSAAAGRGLGLAFMLFASVTSHAQFTSSANVFVGKDAVVAVNSELVNTGNLQSEGTLHLRKGLNNQGRATLGTVILDGQGSQAIASNVPLGAQNVLMAQSGKVVLQSVLKVENQMSFGKGIIENNAATALQIADNATVTGASDRSHVKGFVQKLGDDAFDFPVGDGSSLHTFAVSKPESDDAIQVGFVAQNPLRLSNKRGAEVAEVSENSYWAVQGRNSNPLQVSVGAEAAEAHLLRLSGNQWELSPSVTANNTVSSQATLGGEVYFTIGTQSAELSENADMNVFPNPSDGSFQVRLKGFSPEENISLDIADMSGRVMVKQEGQVKAFNTKYALGQEIPTGNYILKVLRTEKNQTFTQKLLIQK
jgi:hypothetical protein